jgi:prefoldin alpha subunit
MAEDQEANAQDVIMQLRYLQNLYTQQYESLQNSITSYSLSATALQRNIDLLVRYNMVQDSNIMISGEGGVYVPGKIGKSEQVLTYVGGGYLIEQEPAKALEFMRENQKKGEAALSRMLSDKKKLEGELLDIDYKLNALEYQQQGRRQ